jgi:protein-tyrosine phosphatase
MNLLFVCTGNISRSFLAERLLKDEIKKSNVLGIHVSSAGTGAFPDLPGDDEMVKFLLDKDIHAEDHSSRELSDEDIEWADTILVMEEFHYDFILESWPEVEDKVQKLGKYIALDHSEDDIPDPYGKSIYHYRAAQSQITLAISNIFKIISSGASLNA